jgi:CDP-diacylglycerol---serine O-phosphatidyltransferase
MIVPALLMVSTIRFRSFKNVDLQSRRSYPVLVLFAVGLALLASHTELLLLVLAYTYLLSSFVEGAWTRLRRREVVAVGVAAVAGPPAIEIAPDLERKAE